MKFVLKAPNVHSEWGTSVYDYSMAVYVPLPCGLLTALKWWN